VFEGIFAKMFAGVPLDAFDGIPWIPFGRWMMPIGVFLLLVGLRAKTEDRIELFSAYRFGTVLNWWRKRFWKGLAVGIQKAAVLLLMLFACDLLTGRISVFFVEKTIKISVLWMFHIISLDALFLLLDLICVKGFVPAALLLLEGVTFMLGYRIKAISFASYGIWGMYLQSSWYDTDGFCAGMVIAAELFLAATGYYIGHMYLKKSGMRMVWEKEGFWL